MAVAVSPRLYSSAEYLALEEMAEFASEYRDGEIVPMTGGSIHHNRIAGNLFALLKSLLRGRDAKAYIGDLRLWIPEYRRYTYPDVMVIQGQPQFQDDRSDIVINPVLIGEVLSKSTQNYDRGDKFKCYRSIPTFREYLLIDQYQIQIEQFSKTTAEDGWMFQAYDQPEDKIRSSVLGLEIGISDLYEDVNFET
jgi:Uma2 family endonuclease